MSVPFTFNHAAECPQCGQACEVEGTGMPYLDYHLVSYDPPCGHVWTPKDVEQVTREVEHDLMVDAYESTAGEP